MISFLFTGLGQSTHKVNVDLNFRAECLRQGLELNIAQADPVLTISLPWQLEIWD